MNKDNLCVICPRMGMGDLISFLGLFKTISKKHNKKIILLTKESTSGKEIFYQERYIEEIIYLPIFKKGIKNIISVFSNFLHLIKTIKKLNCEQVFVLHSSKRYVFAAKFAGVKYIYAPGTFLQKIFLNKKNVLYGNFKYEKLHPRKESEELLKKILPVNNIENNILNINTDYNNTKHVLLCIACSGDEKQWGYLNYIKLIKYMILLGFKYFVILAGSRQAEMEKKLSKIIIDLKAEVIKSSDLKLNEIINYCKIGKFYVGNDTGFSHLSVSLDIPSLIIHGDLPPHDYSEKFNPIIHEKNIFTKSSIKEINFDRVKNKFDFFLKKYNLINEV